MKKTPIEATVSYFGGEAKLTFVIDGQKHALRCDKNDLATLLHEEGAEIRKISL